MTARMLATRLSWVLDFIALASLAGTGEVRLEVFAVAGALFILSRSGLVRISEKAVMSTLLALVLTAGGVWFRYRYHPILSASYLAPLVHSVLFFAPDTGRYRGWRIGLGFVQMILASALAPEFYLFPAIFCFVILGAVAVSCGFMDAELESRSPEHRMDSLPPGFIRQSITLALLIFLSSMIIFPILPRMKLSGGQSDSFKVGYTERVEIGEKRGLNGHEGTGEPVLRLYAQTGVDLSKEIYLGLIRGRSLDIFDGYNWIASARRAQSLGVQYVKPSDLRDALWVEVDRSAIHSTSLPVPYGALQVQAGAGMDDSPFPRTTGGAWIEPNSTDARVRFFFAFLPYQRHLRHVSLNEDPPAPSDLVVPEVLRTVRMERLTNLLFSSVRNENEKVDKITGFFAKEKFSASLGDSSGDPGSARSVDLPLVERMHPLERFLFLTKEGHCELFASSTVMLLRMAGIPARLVSGFRISKGPVGGVLTLTTNDAHAWVEYWSPSRGWTALDPTPRVIGPSGFSNVLRDGYEWVSAYWYRYVLNFTESRGMKSDGSEPSRLAPEMGASGKSDFRNRLQKFSEHYRFEILVGLGSLLVLSALLYLLVKWRYPWVFSIRHRVREGDAALRRERVRMEKLVLRGSGARDIDEAIELFKRAEQPLLSRALAEWQEFYNQLRFGMEASGSQRDALRVLKRQYDSVRAKKNDSARK